MLRNQGLIPAVLYGPKTPAASLNVAQKEFDKVYEEAGESSLITLMVEGKDRMVLIHDVQRDPISGAAMHVDFYQAPLDRKIEATVPLAFEGEALAVKELGGTLIKNIQEVEVSAFPQDLPPEIQVNVEGLQTFEDTILIKDLVKSEKIEILKDPSDIVAQVVPVEQVEEELERPVEEKVEEVEKVGEKEKKEAEAEEREASKQ